MDFKKSMLCRYRKIIRHIVLYRGLFSYTYTCCSWLYDHFFVHLCHGHDFFFLSPYSAILFTDHIHLLLIIHSSPSISHSIFYKSLPLHPSPAFLSFTLSLPPTSFSLSRAAISFPLNQNKTWEWGDSARQPSLSQLHWADWVTKPSAT